MNTRREEITPLTANAFYVLLALADRPLYGYAIIQQVNHDSGGVVEISPGGVYQVLRQLVTSGLVVEGATSKGRSPHPQRFYEITNFGRQVLQAEAGRQLTAAKLAQRRLA